MSDLPGLLEVCGLGIDFDTPEGVARVVDDVSFTVAPGECVALVGESGCGKSITAKAIVGLLDHRRASVRGTIRFEGTELDRRGRGRRALLGSRIAVVPQDPMAALNPTFQVHDQMRAVYRGVENRYDPDGALRDVGVEDPERILSSWPFQLSGGLAQRVLVGMALLNAPRLVLADEPATALDVRVQQQALDRLRRSVDEDRMGLLLISHDLGLVRRYADRIFVMYAGRIVEEAPADALFDRPAHPYTRALLAALPSMDGTRIPSSIDGDLPDYTAVPEGCRFRPRCPHASEPCVHPVGLREVGDAHRAACVLC
jgi:peptide/nickel transport system ATP-binding protein